MNRQTNYKQLRITSQKNKLPALSQKSFSYSEPKYEIKNQNYQNKLEELSGSIRMLQKKYKQNLKQGFQNKIKSFRLQAVIQRKVIKATIDQTKRQIQEEQLKDKSLRAQNQRQRQNKRLISIQERVQERRRKVRSKAQRQKNEINSKIQYQKQKLSVQNKSAHDKLIQELKHSDRKKMYFQTLRKAQNSQEINREKKEYIQKIIENKQMLEQLKNQLSQMTKSRKISSLEQTPFITI